MVITLKAQRESICNETSTVDEAFCVQELVVVVMVKVPFNSQCLKTKHNSHNTTANQILIFSCVDFPILIDLAVLAAIWIVVTQDIKSQNVRISGDFIKSYLGPTRVVCYICWL